MLSLIAEKFSRQQDVSLEVYLGLRVDQFLPEYITEVILQVLPAVESCPEVGLYLVSLGLQTLIRPVVDSVFVGLSIEKSTLISPDSSRYCALIG